MYLSATSRFLSGIGVQRLPKVYAALANAVLEVRKVLPGDMTTLG